MKCRWRMLFIGVGIILSCMLGYRVIFGHRIDHFKQYLVPCQGRINFYEGEAARFSLSMIDEEEMSEMADGSNIRQAMLVTTEGKEISCTSWTVEENLGLCKDDNYVGRYLRLECYPKRECVIKQLKLQYTDVTEVFEIGELTLHPLDTQSELAYLSFDSAYGRFTHESYDSEMPYIYKPSNYCLLSAASMGREYILTEINLGVQGLGVDADTIRAIEFPFESGAAFDTEENKVFFANEICEKLPKSNLNIRIYGKENQEDAYIVHLAKDISFQEYRNQDVLKEPYNFYINPIFYCISVKTGEIVEYGEMGGITAGPMYYSTAYAKQLLEEYGE